MEQEQVTPEMVRNLQNDIELRYAKLNVDIWGKNYNQWMPKQEVNSIHIVSVDMMTFENFHNHSKLDDISQFIMDGQFCFVYYLNERSATFPSKFNIYQAFIDKKYNFITDMFPDKVIVFQNVPHNYQEQYIILTFDVKFEGNETMINLAIPLEYYIKNAETLAQNVLDNKDTDNFKPILTEKDWSIMTEALSQEEIDRLNDAVSENSNNKN